MKTIVVEVPDWAESAMVSCYRDNWIKPPDCTTEPSFIAPILHGRRALLKKVLEVGEFEAEERLPKKGETYLGALAGAKLNIHRANCDHAASVLPVLTNLDEPEEQGEVDEGKTCPSCEKGKLGVVKKDLAFTYKKEKRVFGGRKIYQCNVCDYEALSREDTQKIDEAMTDFRHSIDLDEPEEDEWEKLKHHVKKFNSARWSHTLSYIMNELDKRCPRKGG